MTSRWLTALLIVGITVLIGRSVTPQTVDAGTSVDAEDSKTPVAQVRVDNAGRLELTILNAKTNQPEAAWMVDRKNFLDEIPADATIRLVATPDVQFSLLQELYTVIRQAKGVEASIEIAVIPSINEHAASDTPATVASSDNTEQPGEPITVHIVSSGNANVTVSTLRQILTDEPVSVKASEDGKYLMITGAREHVNRVASLLNQLTRTNQGPDAIHSADAAVPAGATEVWPQAPGELAKLYQNADERSQALAAEFQTLRKRGDNEDTSTQMAVLKQQVRQEILNAFNARQQQQQQELEQFRKRLQDIEQMVQQREAVKQEIVDKRLYELLYPDLRWEASSKLQPPANVPLSGNRPAIAGAILQFDKDKQFVEVSVGADDGIKLNDRLVVIRQSGNTTKLVARVKVCQVEADCALARLEQTYDTIQKGDTVIHALDE